MRFKDALKIHQEEGLQAFLDTCRYNRRLSLNRRAAKHRLLPSFVRTSREHLMWKEGFEIYRTYADRWREQRAFLRRIKETTKILDRLKKVRYEQPC